MDQFTHTTTNEVRSIILKSTNASCDLDPLPTRLLKYAYKRFHSTETALLKINNDIICNMDNGKITLLDLSTAFDTIDQVVKKVVSYIAKPLSDICHKSFTRGVFPDNMKIGKVIPLYKAGDINVFSNYRPI